MKNIDAPKGHIEDLPRGRTAYLFAWVVDAELKTDLIHLPGDSRYHLGNYVISRQDTAVGDKSCVGWNDNALALVGGVEGQLGTITQSDGPTRAYSGPVFAATDRSVAAGKVPVRNQVSPGW